MAKPAVAAAVAAPAKHLKKPPVVDRNTLLLREMEKTKKTFSDASVLVSKDLAAVMSAHNS
jgi:hypothetical protein